MPTTLALWHAEHVNFARLLNVLDGQLMLFHGGKVPDYELMLNIMFYMTHYSDVLHHPKEDLVFAKMREREIGVAATVDKLAAQHARLHDAGRELVRAVPPERLPAATAAAETELAGARAGDGGIQLTTRVRIVVADR